MFVLGDLYESVELVFFWVVCEVCVGEDEVFGFWFAGFPRAED